MAVPVVLVAIGALLLLRSVAADVCVELARALVEPSEGAAAVRLQLAVGRAAVQSGGSEGGGIGGCGNARSADGAGARAGGVVVGTMVAAVV